MISMVAKSGFGKLLKVFGIIDIVMGVLVLLFSITLLAAAPLTSGQTDLYNQMVDIQVASVAIGAILMVTSALMLVGGIASVRFANNPTRTPAFVLTLVGSILSVVGGISSTLRTDTGDASGIIGGIIGIVINVLLVFAAIKVRSEAK